MSEGPNLPQLGIFWHIVTAATGPTLLADAVPTAEAEPYGDFLTHGGHYEFWTKLAEMGPANYASEVSPMWQNGPSTKNGPEEESYSTCRPAATSSTPTAS